MMLVPTNSLDIVPRVNLMALVAFVDSGFRLFRHSLRNHLEMFHVMAGRRLVALGATGRARRWMKKTAYGPLGRSVTLCAILAEQLKVGIFVRVAARAIQRHLLPADVWTRAF